MGKSWWVYTGLLISTQNSAHIIGYTVSTLPKLDCHPLQWDGRKWGRSATALGIKYMYIRTLVYIIGYDMIPWIGLIIGE